MNQLQMPKMDLTQLIDMANKVKSSVENFKLSDVTKLIPPEVTQKAAKLSQQASAKKDEALTEAQKVISSASDKAQAVKAAQKELGYKYSPEPAGSYKDVVSRAQGVGNWLLSAE